MKIVFMGTPNFAVNILEGLIEKYKVSLVVTQPDKIVGRKKILMPSPVKQKAIEHNIPVFQPRNIKESYQEILNKEPDIIITCAYGQILPEELIKYPHLSSINVHASLLPKYRGGAPIHRAIINGDQKTGITIMYMEKGMDTGDIISKKETLIEENDNLETLSNKLSLLGKELLLKTLPSIINGVNERFKQNEEDVTYAYNITPEEEKIDFNKTSKEIYNQIRGLSPSIGAYCILDNNRFKVYKARIGKKKYNNIGIINKVYKDGISVSTKDGEIIFEEVQAFGKKKMKVEDYINGFGEKNLVNKELL